MKAIFFYSSLLVLMTGIYSCHKRPEVVIPDPAAEVTLNRTILFPNRNNATKTASYDALYGVKAKAGVTNGEMYLYFDAEAKTNGSSGDELVLFIDSSHLKNGLVKTYTFQQTGAALLNARYDYSYKNIDGGLHKGIIDSRLGVVFEGELIITGYDAGRKLISGRYSVNAKNLIDDPSTESSVILIDPLNKCDLMVSGQFKNIKLL